MKFTSIAAATLVAATASAKDVACRINGKQESVVDLDTGVCSFEIPSTLPVTFDFTAIDDYTVDAYYVAKDTEKFWNDIANAGRVIEIAAKTLYNGGDLGLFHVHDELSPVSNSTASFKKRFHSQIMTKRDEISDLVAHIKSLNGISAVSSGFSIEISDPDVVSSSASASGSGSGSGSDVTVTDATTTLITITSCSENKCSKTAVPATKGPTTTTVDGQETVYTTWCPVTGDATATVTHKDTTIITITSCSDDKCHTSAVAATRGPTTATVGGEETVYTTWCPLTDASATATVTEKETTVITVTSCSDNKCVETEIPATQGSTSVVSNGETIIYTTLYPVASTATGVHPVVSAGAHTTATTPVVSAGAHTTVAIVASSQSTVAGVSATPAVSSLINGAGKMGASLFAAVALPLAYLL